MKILVTGGAGFIGSHVCDALLARGNKVICIDNFNNYYDPKIKEKNIEHNLSNDNFKLFKTDILDFNRMKEIFTLEQPDKIVHLAARAGVRPSIEDPFLYQEVNVRGTLNMLELAKNFKIKNFVFASSSSVYGNRENGPFSEKDNVDFPISPYAATKKAGEELCYTYHHLFNLKITCLRLFTVYGPRGRPDLAIRKFTSMILKDNEIPLYGNGKSMRDYTYVSDIAEGILKSLDNDLNFEIINLGNTRPISLNYMIKVLGDNLKTIKTKNLPEQAGDVKLTFANIEKANDLLSWKPEVNFEDGIKRFIEWFKNNCN